MKPVRIFHTECPSPQDLLDGRAEGPVLRAITPLIGHRLHSQIIASRTQFEEMVRHLGTLPRRDDPQKKLAVVLHISGHGDKDGIRIGADDLDWADLVEILEPFVSIGGAYPGKRIVVLSSCFANKQKLADALMRGGNRRRVPLDYLFCTEREVEWDHAAVAWTVFYHLLPQVDLDEKNSVQGALKKVYGLGTTLHYWRWDKKKRKYKHYSP
ncbi:MAG TPA: hypothetical protein VNA24_17230 [Hyalangium sp.]|nr:hypothetical protein [Hyalangium sp.]